MHGAVGGGVGESPGRCRGRVATENSSACSPDSAHLCANFSDAVVTQKHGLLPTLVRTVHA